MLGGVALISHSQVWIDHLLLSSFVQASIWAIAEHSLIKRLKAWVRSKEEDAFASTVQHADRVEGMLVNLMCSTALVFAFGCWLPWLLIFAPVFIMVNMYHPTFTRLGRKAPFNIAGVPSNLISNQDLLTSVKPSQLRFW